jgi:alpha-1,3-glucosyltransferase
VEYAQVFYLAIAYLCYVTALDYPPFFAYLEKLLSIPASLIDPNIVDLNNLNYDGWSVIGYQRTTVILTELVLGIVLLKYASIRCVRCLLIFFSYRFIRGSIEPPIQWIISASIFLHPGFLIVDHIHFQYNGFMYGILLWSILMARNVMSLCSKHYPLADIFAGKQTCKRNPIRHPAEF